MEVESYPGKKTCLTCFSPFLGVSNQALFFNFTGHLRTPNLAFLQCRHRRRWSREDGARAHAATGGDRSEAGTIWWDLFIGFHRVFHMVIKGFIGFDPPVGFFGTS